MKEQADLRKILKAGKLGSELDLERALVLDRKLRLMAKDEPQLLETRNKLRSIIQAYEKSNWSKDAEINDEQIRESDIAESIAEQERVFLEKRKTAIKEKLEALKMNQQEMGKLLGHGKSYMSELMNGLSPFGMRDLIIMHRLFAIPLETLIPTIISQKDRAKIKTSLKQLNNPEIKLDK